MLGPFSVIDLGQLACVAGLLLPFLGQRVWRRRSAASRSGVARPASGARSDVAGTLSRLWPSRGISRQPLIVMASTSGHDGEGEYGTPFGSLTSIGFIDFDGEGEVGREHLLPSPLRPS